MGGYVPELKRHSQRQQGRHLPGADPEPEADVRCLAGPL